MSKIKINGQYVEVKEGDEITIDADAADETTDKSLMEQAAKIGAKIAEEAVAKMNLGDANLSKRVSRMVDDFYGNDSKLKTILNGKDLFGGDELTKEEKIVGFYHALVTNNQPALKALAEGVDADGGYLFPHEFLGEIVRQLPALNELRQVVRVIPMKRNKMDITSLTEKPKVYWTAENVAKTTTTARFAQSTLQAFKAAAILYASDELIEDSTEFDLVSLIITLFAETVAEEEERVLMLGNGTTQPQGINVATLGGTVNGTGNIFNDITATFYALPRRYRKNASWICSSATLQDLEGLKDTTGRPIFTQGSDEIAPYLKGRPVVINEDAPDRTIFFGDWKRAYFLGDRKRMTAKISNDTETAFTKDQTAIRVVFRIGGLVVLAAATRKCTNF
jgi:HK97 family phage major capsid protein